MSGEGQSHRHASDVDVDRYLRLKKLLHCCEDARSWVHTHIDQTPDQDLHHV